MVVRTIRDLGAAVRGRRQEVGLNQGQLAALAGVSRKWVYEFEAGKPTAEFGLVLRVLDALDLQLELEAWADRSSDRGDRSSVDLDTVFEQLRNDEGEREKL